MDPEVEKRLTRAEREFLFSKHRAPEVFLEGERARSAAAYKAAVEATFSRYVGSYGKQPPYVPGRIVPVSVRPTVQVYHDGLVREKYTDTGELVPINEALARYYKGERKKPRKPAPLPPTKRPAKTPPMLTVLAERDRGCVRCGTFADLTRHHVVHKSKRGPGTPDNLQTLCRSCHAFVHEVLQLPSGVRYSREGADAMAAEHTAFDAYRRDRARAKKRVKNYKFGPDLATNMAAPFVVRLRAEVQQQAKALAETGGLSHYSAVEHPGPSPAA